ncbi:uncharacterized protein LOC124374962 [Homalodisca vitripennis]|uniref:uncharacterized protein LOC124374962 n=1 Tax=Homalodisca vitripennis TaxID=197043 RepID=UPI001EEC6BC3|nr:uncharacterized protein LOC124374962 [Homalodisca vitripennis]
MNLTQLHSENWEVWPFKILYQSDRSHFNGSVAAYFYPRLDQLFEERNVDSYTREALRYLTPLWEGAASGTEDLSVSGAWGQSNYWECEGDYTLKWKKMALEDIKLSSTFYLKKSQTLLRSCQW